MLPIVALIAIVVIVLFIVFAMRKRNKGQDLGDPKAGR
jgi:heme/copper-type cytochrome/quinol oxidase subunit 2